MDFATEAGIMRSLAKIVERGHLVRGAKPVHWCFDCGSALAEAEIEYADKVSPAVDVAYSARNPSRLAAAFGVAVEEGVDVAMPIWTTTPWTLPASLAVSIGPELEYVLVEGPKTKDGDRCLLVLAEALATKALARYGIDDVTVLGNVNGSELDGQVLQHPFYADRDIPVLVGEHVTADDGTGVVHTAPGHGQEDFVVGQRYGLLEKYTAAQMNPVDGRGLYLPSTPPADGVTLAGLHIWKANDTIIEVLRNSGHLLAQFKLEHSYPHCWRHKTPVAFRATPQWFISMEQAHLAPRCAARNRQGAWIPEWGEARIYGMIEGRPDWCISRQRTWGVPIALFVDRETGEPHPRSPELMRQVADMVEREGVDAWYSLDAARCSATERRKYDKVTDILDVWFDSGVTHECVLAHVRRTACTSRPICIWKAPTSIAAGSTARCSPPWRWTACAVPPGAHARLHRRRAGQEDVQVARQHGRAAEGHQRDGRRRAAPVDRLRPTTATRCRSRQHPQAQRRRAIAASAIPRASCSPTSTASIRCSTCVRSTTWSRWTAGSCIAPSRCSSRSPRPTRTTTSPRSCSCCRTSAASTWVAVPGRHQGPPLHDARGLARPSFGAERDVPHRRGLRALDRAHPQLHRRRDVAVPACRYRRWAGARTTCCSRTWYDGLAPLSDGAPLSAADFDRLLALREEVSRTLEPMRAAGEIGAALEAEIGLRCSTADQNWLVPMADELRFPIHQRRRGGAGR
jgi:predicted TIM-barrel enzyme